MDIEQKKKDIQADIVRQPANVVFARIDIVNELQLADLMKTEFTPFFMQTARSAASSSNGDTADSLHQVCINLAKQRALLQGATVNHPIYFDIGAITDYTHSTNLTFPKLQDSSYSNKTSLPYVVMHDLNADGGMVTLSSTTNANTDIVNDDGENVKYFTDFSKYFLTRSRANGELISIDENNAPYTTPTAAEPFVPANTINGGTFVGTASDPTANTDVRHEFSLTANTSAVGFAGANNDITENKFVGNTFVTLALSNVSGSFSVSETITDFDGSIATVKSASNTTTVFLESGDVKGTFQSGEILTDGSTNASISSIETANTSASLTLTGSSFATGSNTSLDLGFAVANTITLDENTVVRNGSIVTVTANNHGVAPGEYIVLKGADDAFGEFNDTFSVEDVTQNTLTFSTSNSVSVTPTGDFSLVKNIVFGRTSNASAAIQSRTVNSSASLVFQSSDLSAGFPVGNTVTGSDSTATGAIDTRTIDGAWYQVKTNEVKTYYIASDSGTWDYHASNNPKGIESTANTGEFWLKNFEMAKINQIVAGTNSGTSSETAPKMVLDIALATSGDKSGGYDSTIDTRLPGTYFAYPLKTYADQVHDGVTTLEAFSNFANVVIAPEGLEVNFDWKPLANNSGVATNTTHINQDGSVATSAHNPENVTTLNKANFIAHLGPFDGTKSNDVYTSISSVKSSAVKTHSTQSYSGTDLSSSNYHNANANPFFPAVGGTHKNYTDKENGITGTQPATLNANDIYAGSYTEIQTGAVDPGPNLNFRYIIQNDLKWIYATQPLASNVAALQVSGTAYTATYNGEIDTELNAVQTISADSGTSGSTLMVIPENTQNIANETNYNAGGIKEYRFDSSGTGLIQQRVRPITRSGTEGSYTYSFSGTDVFGSYAEFPCFFNRMQYLISSAKTAQIGGTSGNYTVANMETNFGILYQLLKNLENADYGKSFEDPMCNANGEHPDGTYNSGTAPGQSDSSFEQETNDMKTAMDALITDHNTEHGRTASHSFTYDAGADNSLTHPNDYRTTYHANFVTELTNYRVVIKRRIIEISNRIGYLNGKDVAYYSGTAPANGPSKESGYNTSNGGFAGYTFNSGKGYANTVYSHANFMAGKKIKLLEKIQTAIDDVQSLYDQIKSKRSQYYEYNQ